MRRKNWSRYLDSLHRFSIELGGLVQVANRRDPRATRRPPRATERRADHAAHIASWLQLLRNDKRFVFAAAGHVQRAADYLHGLQPRAISPEPPEDERAAV